jgi:tetratricopeptide (TPR) repeat protein
MKKVIFSICVCLLTTTMLFAQENDMEALWVKGNNAYSLGEYTNALEAYKQIEEGGYLSARLLYNMGNTYYKLQEDGRAILYYERALKFDPANEDIKNNLEIARLKTLDKIESVPEFILTTWTKDLRNSMSSDKWAWSGLVMLLVTALLMLLFRHAPTVGQRKLSFVMACLTFLFVMVAFIFSLNLRHKAADSDFAVILSPVSNVKSAPNSTGGNLFILHEGTKVEILESVGQWSKVELSDGRQGWMESKDFETI